VLLNDGDKKAVVRVGDKGHLAGLGRARLARELFSGRFRPGQSLHTALQTDLEGAKDVQRAFFPAPTLSIPCLSCEAFYQPAHDIGGDHYDFLPLQGERWGIAIGDVSGKGIGAALIMASLQGSLRAQALHPHSDLSLLISDVNRLVYDSSPTHFFASLFYAEYQPATRLEIRKCWPQSSGRTPPATWAVRNFPPEGGSRARGNLLGCAIHNGNISAPNW